MLSSKLGENNIVIPQVNLLSFVEVDNSFENLYDEIETLRKFTVDYLIIDSVTTEPKLVIELDGKSHESFGKKNRDHYVNQVCSKAKLPIGHIQVGEDFKKMNEKQADPAYKKAKDLKKIKVVEVNKMLKEALSKEGYIELQFEKPDMGKFVAVPFTVPDEKPEREEYDSKKQLKKIISTTLEKTNWRLMSDGVNYRVGYLSGKLRCYETEEDLMKILQ
ncbi:DUF2726 domain-containing protein [Candidatus Woesebacteria bacterium]|nr:DUF2726 domain-containing protein [Candidatus Woesebacteria bacterium]